MTSRGLWFREASLKELLETRDFFVSQTRELSFTRPLRQPAIVMAQEPVQQVNGPCRHVHDLLHASGEPVLRLQVRDFLR
jgi:hypothetical protein